MKLEFDPTADAAYFEYFLSGGRNQQGNRAWYCRWLWHRVEMSSTLRIFLSASADSLRIWMRSL